MKKLIAPAALAVAILTAPAALAAGKCTASADSTWAGAGPGYKVETFASGDKCETAMAVIVIRDETGAPGYYAAHPADSVAVLAGMASAKDLETALRNWVDPSQAAFQTTADLPEWKDGQEQPMLGEFYFYPEQGIDRPTYDKIRNSKAPIYCYVQGMESLACITRDAEGGGLFKVGVQSFPG